MKRSFKAVKLRDGGVTQEIMVVKVFLVPLQSPSEIPLYDGRQVRPAYDVRCSHQALWHMDPLLSLNTCLVESLPSYLNCYQDLV